jgi:hypothetical protein
MKEDATEKHKTRIIPIGEYFNERVSGFVATSAAKVIREVKRLTKEMRFWQAARRTDGKLFPLSEPALQGPMDDGAFVIRMYATSSEQTKAPGTDTSPIGEEATALEAISIMVRPLTPATAHKQRTKVVATCRHLYTYEAFLHLMNEVKALFGPLWKDVQPAAHPLRRAQDEAEQRETKPVDAVSGTRNSGRKIADYAEVVRLYLEEKKAVPMIAQEFGVTRARIYQVLREQGVHRGVKKD